MTFKRIFWSLVKEALHHYTQKNNAISRCYIRHSAASGPQHVLFSDVDLTFFVKARNMEQLRDLRKQISADLINSRLLCNHAKDSLFLPHTKSAYRLCEEAYPFRSKYPFATWLPVDKKESSARISPRICLPLDHVPENFLLSHLTPLVRGHKKSRILEHAFLSRKLNEDRLWLKVKDPFKKFQSFDEILLANIGIWDRFYKTINFTSHQENVSCRLGPFNYLSFPKRLKNIADDPSCKEAITSLWVSPASHDDHIVNVNLNVRSSVSAGTCRKAIEKVLAALGRSRYALFLGTEGSMIARISGLRGHFLLDPWLLKYQGCCLVGSPELKERIQEPSIEMLKEKYREFLFSFMVSTRFVGQNSYPYAIYRSCFTLDHLFRHHELTLDQKDLSAVYGQEFIPQEKFNPKEHTSQFLLSLKEKHGFDLFGD